MSYRTRPCRAAVQMKCPRDILGNMTHMLRFAAVAGAVALLATLEAQPATSVDPDLYAGMRWRSIGPDRGGRSIAAAGTAARANEYYFGATGGGVWKTTDFGHTWNPVGDQQFKTSSVGAIAIAPSNPDVVYAGMGESCFRGNIIQGDGVYK